tara:strand:- start:158 stop:364 length:207 start_codon:yes stop_codon:yes gene_type:complete
MNKSPQMITAREVMQMTTYSRNHIYRLMRRGEFPQCHKLNPNRERSRVVWKRAEVEGWLHERVGEECA